MKYFLLVHLLLLVVASSFNIDRCKHCVGSKRTYCRKQRDDSDAPLTTNESCTPKGSDCSVTALTTVAECIEEADSFQVSERDSRSDGDIQVVIFLAVVLVAALLLLVCFLWWYRQRQRSTQTPRHFVTPDSSNPPTRVRIIHRKHQTHVPVAKSPVLPDVGTATKAPPRSKVSVVTPNPPSHNPSFITNTPSLATPNPPAVNPSFVSSVAVPAAATEPVQPTGNGRTLSAMKQGRRNPHLPPNWNH